MKKYKKDTKKQQQQNQAQNSLIKPGNESVRVNREDMNLLDKMNVVLAEWCYALNYAPSIPVWFIIIIIIIIIKDDTDHEQFQTQI